eukprot:12366266-Heterocapsa_arctica.AAC.1
MRWAKVDREGRQICRKFQHGLCHDQSSWYPAQCPHHLQHVCGLCLRGGHGARVCDGEPPSPHQ